MFRKILIFFTLLFSFSITFAFEWKTGTPESQGMDSTVLAKMTEELNSRQTAFSNSIHSFIIIRNDVIIAESYFNPYSEKELHHIASCTKSVESAIIGIGIREGWFTGQQEKLSALLPEYTDIWKDKKKASITLSNALTMASGFDWSDDTNTTPMLQSNDPVRYLLELPLSDEPGTVFRYNTGMNQVLAKALKNRSGKNLEELTKEYLFKPLGISNYIWWKTPQGEPAGGYGLWLTLRDQAKLPLLYLHRGVWDGKEIVPWEWVKESLTPYIACWDHYMGFQWRISPNGDYFYAHGHGGQTLLFSIDNNMVIVFNATTYEEPFEMIEKFIVPSIKSPKSLKENPAGVNRLKIAAEDAFHPKAKNVNLPKEAIDGSGTEYNLESNPLGITWTRIMFDKKSLQKNNPEAQLEYKTGSQLVSLKVGLDGISRVNEFGPGNPPVLARGEWQDRRTFLLELQNIGITSRSLYTIRYNGDNITVGSVQFPERTRFSINGHKVNSAVKTPVKEDYSAFVNPEYWKNQALNDIIPFWEKTIDKEKGGFFTDINKDGSIGAERGKYPRMLSRAIFGFSTAYLLSGDEKYLKLAQYGLAYLTNFGWDKDNGGWYRYINGDNQPVQTPKDLFDETYGNLGPVFYYFVTHDKNSLSYVEKTHRLIQTAWDQNNGGYYGVVNADWTKGMGTKSFNAEIDTCSAYLIYYYLFTRNPGLLKDLDRIADTAVTHMINPKTGFVGETFSEGWKSIDPTLWAGHNLKTGWVLLRTFWLTGKKQYADTALKIAEAQMKYCWDSRYYGWFFQFNEENPKVVNDSKDWWTQEEGNVLMLNMYHKNGGESYLQRFKEASYFWDKYLIDHQDKDCYPTTYRDGTPLSTQKGNLYKSAYHTMEQGLLNYLYLNLYVNKGEAVLYFNLSSDVKNEKHYVIPLEDPAVIIKRVEINGKPWDQFSAKEGFVSLPSGKNMKVKVVYGVSQ